MKQLVLFGFLLMAVQAQALSDLWPKSAGVSLLTGDFLSDYGNAAAFEQETNNPSLFVHSELIEVPIRKAALRFGGYFHYYSNRFGLDEELQPFISDHMYRVVKRSLGAYVSFSIKRFEASVMYGVGESELACANTQCSDFFNERSRDSVDALDFGYKFGYEVVDDLVLEFVYLIGFAGDAELQSSDPIDQRFTVEMAMESYGLGLNYRF